jgi:glycosyltransferase involved in cell wall biosynthesis
MGLLRVSIIIPTHNRANLLKRAIQSVLAQSFEDWELIVIDDASKDETRGMLAGYVSKDHRIRVVRNEQSQYPDISGILNQGLEKARGEYVARLDDDDYWHDQNKLKTQVGFLDEHKDYVVVGGGMIVVDGCGRELYRFLKKEKDVDIRRYALSANPFAHTTVVFRRAEALSVGGYGKWSYAEDWELWLKLGTRGRVYNFPRYFTSYLFNNQNKSFVFQRIQTRTILSFLWLHRRDYPNFFFGFVLNIMQYVFSWTPLFLRKIIHPFLSYWKRKSF